MELWTCFNTPLTVVLVGSSLVLVYLYGKKRNRFLKEAGFDGPQPVIFLGNILQMANMGFVNCFHEYEKQYGKVYGVYFGGGPAITVTDLDILREVLVKQFSNFSDRLILDLNPDDIATGLLFEKGAAWARLRSICSPSFSVSKLKLLCGRINVCSEILTENVMRCAKNDETVTMKDYLGAFTMDVIASTAFGMEVNSQNDPKNLFVANAKKLLADDLTQRPVLLLALAFPGILPFLRWCGVRFFPKPAMDFFVEAVTQQIDERKQKTLYEQNQPLDFLQLLINAEDDGKSEEPGPLESGSRRKNTKRMSKDEIIGQCFLFLVAGYDTTATALTFTTHALATNPDVQEKLINEIDNVIGDDEPTYDSIAELKYLDHVISESLRLYPPIPQVTRIINNTVTIKGYTFPKGASINIPTTVIHRDPEQYPDSLSFRPERWENRSDMDPLSYLPFGYGPRMCIGMRLALIEAKIALVHILKKMKFVRLPETKDVIEFANAPILTPKQPIRLRLHIR